MDTERLVDSEIRELRKFIQDAESLIDRLSAARDKTLEVLGIAEGVGVTVVGLNVLPEERESWSFGARGNIFTLEEDRMPRDSSGGGGYPAAWHIAKQAGIGHGAGNTGQHQIPADSVIDGVYECRDGKWFRRGDTEGEA